MGNLLSVLFTIPRQKWDISFLCKEDVVIFVAIILFFLFGATDVSTIRRDLDKWDRRDKKLRCYTNSENQCFSSLSLSLVRSAPVWRKCRDFMLNSGWKRSRNFHQCNFSFFLVYVGGKKRTNEALHLLWAAISYCLK